MLFQRVLLLLTISLFANNLFAQLDTAFWFVAPEVTQIHGDRPIVFRFSSLENASTITIDQPSNPTFKSVVPFNPLTNGKAQSFNSIITPVKAFSP